MFAEPQSQESARFGTSMRDIVPQGRRQGKVEAHCTLLERPWAGLDKDKVSFVCPACASDRRQQAGKGSVAGGMPDLPSLAVGSVVNLASPVHDPQ